MELTVSLNYPADPHRVADMFADPQYTLGSRFAGLNLPDSLMDHMQVRSEPKGEGFTVTLAGDIPAEKMPSGLRSYLPASASFNAVDAWSAPQADGSRTGTLNISVRGVPATITADQTIAPGATPGTTVRTVKANVSVKIPFMGSMIERKAAAHVETVLRREEAAGASWLAQH